MAETTLQPPVDPARDHSAGQNDAPVILAEYGDEDCPLCGAAYPVVQGLQREFGDRLRFVWRHFPRPEHPHAHPAAEAAEAAGAQGRYWQMQDVLLTHQRALEQTDLERYAAEIGVDVERFRRDLRPPTTHEQVAEGLAAAVHSGAHGTPTFFVNGPRGPVAGAAGSPCRRTPRPWSHLEGDHGLSYLRPVAAYIGRTNSEAVKPDAGWRHGRRGVGRRHWRNRLSPEDW